MSKAHKFFKGLPGTGIAAAAPKGRQATTFGGSDCDCNDDCNDHCDCCDCGPGDSE